MKKLRITLAIALIAMLIVHGASSALATEEIIDSGNLGQAVEWTLTADNVLTISGTGEPEVEWYDPEWYDYSNDIETVVIEEGITGLPGTFFSDLYNVSKVYISSTVTRIDGVGLEDLNSLSEFVVDEENENFVSDDNALYAYGKNELVYYYQSSENKVFTVPSEVTKINKYSFSNSSSLEVLIIPESVKSFEISFLEHTNIKELYISAEVDTLPSHSLSSSHVEKVVISEHITEIAEGVFYNCWELESIYIGKNVEEIRMDAFAYCGDLKVVHYSGDDINDIAIGPGNERLLDAEIHYVTEKVEPSVADCDTNGYTSGYYCELCEENVSGILTEQATGHEWENGVCEKCDIPCEHSVEELDGICVDCKKYVGFPEASFYTENSVKVRNSQTGTIVKLVPSETAYYQIDSIVSDEEDVDPYAELFNSEKEVAGSDDDDGEGLNFKLICLLEKGQTYYLKLKAYDDECEYSYKISKYVGIVNHPTKYNPTVVASGATKPVYKWYEVIANNVVVSDINNGAPYVEGELKSSYDAEYGWTPVYSQEIGGYVVAKIKLEAGDNLVLDSKDVDLNPEDHYGYIMLTDGNMGYDLDFEMDGTVHVEIEYGGEYYLVMRDANRIIASVETYSYKLLENKNTDTLQDGEIGKKYVVDVWFDSQMFTSEMFEFDFLFTHEPTEEEPYVSTTMTDVKYQWYSVDINGEEIDDVTPVNCNGVESVYDSQNGWKGVVSEDGYAFEFFEIKLKEGETIKVEVKGCEEFYIDVIERNYEEYSFIAQIGNDCYTVAPMDGTYVVEIYFDNELVDKDIEIYTKVYDVEYNYTKLDGETGAALKTKAEGMYVCDVTHKSRMITSDILNISHNKDGWVEIDGVWYYFEDGEMVRNDWRLDSTGWCFLDADGKWVKNEFVLDSTGKYAFITKDGYYYETTGWVELDSDWYYLEKGYRVENDWRLDSTGWCFLDTDGKWVKDEFVLDSTGKYAFITKDGYYYETTGWVELDSDWYYLEKGYRVENDWRKDSTGWCFLDKDGKWVKNVFVLDSTGKWAYITKNGYYYETTGWLEYYGKWFYLEKGYAVTNDWRKDSTGWCYLGQTGAMLTDTWIEDSVGWCYIGSNGYCYMNGTFTIDGEEYTFDENGRLVEEG